VQLPALPGEAGSGVNQEPPQPLRAGSSFPRAPPSSFQGGWTQRPFQVPSNPNCPMILQRLHTGPLPCSGRRPHGHSPTPRPNEPLAPFRRGGMTTAVDQLRAQGIRFPRWSRALPRPRLPPELPGGRSGSVPPGRDARAEAAGACQEQDSQEGKHGLGSVEDQAGAGCALGGHVRQTDRNTHAHPASPQRSFAPSSALAVFRASRAGRQPPLLPAPPSSPAPPLTTFLCSSRGSPDAHRACPCYLWVKQANPRPSSAQTAGNEHTARPDAWPNPIKLFIGSQ